MAEVSTLDCPLMRAPLRCNAWLTFVPGSTFVMTTNTTTPLTCPLALVAGPAGEIVGTAALEDLLEELIGEFDDETDLPDVP
jgi:Mg2+/Co2+ transporter CorB